MILLLIFIALLGAGIVMTIIDSGWFNALGVSGIITAVIGGIGVLFVGLLLLLVPITATSFEAKYNATVETIADFRANGVDIERAGVLNAANEINIEIEQARVWRQNPITRQFYSARIAELEKIR